MSKRKSKDNNGNISYKGIVGDTYNFEYNFDLAYYYNKIFKSNLNNTEKNESGILSHIGTEFLNNGAYFVQKYGSLIPYNWTAEIGGKL